MRKFLWGRATVARRERVGRVGQITGYNVQPALHFSWGARRICSIQIPAPLRTTCEDETRVSCYTVRLLTILALVICYVATGAALTHLSFSNSYALLCGGLPDGV